MENNVLKDDFDMSRIIGQPYEVVAQDKTIEWETAFPILDPETMTVVGTVDGHYPEEFNNGQWVTGALVDGKIKTGEFLVDFAVTA